jgi:hypothetical protein
MMLTDSTAPTCENKPLSSSSVVLNDRLPTKIFFDMFFLIEICKEHRGLGGKGIKKQNQLSGQ